MIAGDRSQLAAAPQIAAAVAHPSEVCARAAHEDAHERGAQTALAPALRFARFADALVGPLRRDVEEVGGLVLLRIVSERPRRIRVLRQLEEPLQGLDRDPACHLACLVSAHSVADGRQLEPRRDQQGVFVVVPFAPDVGRPGEFERHPREHS